MNERIIELARAVSGAGEAETSLLEALCGAAESTWMSRLRPGVAPADCGEAYVCAAAFTAAADLAAGRGGEQISGFTAGEITIRTKSAGEAAGAAGELRRTAERLMVPYAEPEGFCFLGVKG